MKSVKVFIGSVLQLALNVLKDKERPGNCIILPISSLRMLATPCEARSEMKQRIQKEKKKNSEIKKNEQVHFKYHHMSAAVIQHPRTGRHLVTDGSFVLCEGEMWDGVFKV